MTAEEMEQNVQEIWALFRETDRRFKETDKNFQELRALFTSQWGKLIEALIAPGALKQFQEKGVPVTGTRQRAKQRKNGEEMEIDILATNEDNVIAVEVKTTLKVEDVKDYLEQLPRFKEFFEEYRNMKLYGAVAGVSIEEKADRYAYKNGLFVLTLSGEGTVVILNDEKFIPKDFSKTSRNEFFRWENQQAEETMMKLIKWIGMIVMAVSTIVAFGESDEETQNENRFLANIRQLTL